MKILGQDEARKCVAANATPRMLELGKLRAYVDGTQYDGRPSWWDRSVNLFDRAPCVVWHCADGAISSNEDLLLGEGRYPAITSKPDEDQGDEDEALDEESSATLDKFILHIEREASVRAHVRESYREGQAVRTCIGLCGVREGRLFCESIRAEFTDVTWDASGKVVTSVKIQYPYIDLMKEADGQWRARALLFKRVIDDKRDVTFLPGIALETGAEPAWEEDTTKTVSHGLGFCPVIAHKFRCAASIVNQIDGHAIHETLFAEIDAFNFEASIRHKGAMYSLPQRYETGVDRDYNPTAPRSAGMTVYGTPNAGHYDPRNVAGAPPGLQVFRGQQDPTQTSGMRKQGPDEVWQYESPEVKVGQLTLDSGALEALSDTMADLRARITETLAWVPLNPEEIKFAAALSGKALERLLARQLNRVAKDRDGFGDGYIKPLYSMLLRVALKSAAGLKTRGSKKAMPVLQTFEAQTEGWTDPPLSLAWGNWFNPVPEDEKFTVDSTIALYREKLITKRTAVEKIKTLAKIENVDAYLESLEEEAEERAEQEQEQLRRKVEEAQADAHNAAKQRAGGSNPQAPNAGGGGGTNAAPAGKAQSAPKSGPGPKKT